MISKILLKSAILALGWALACGGALAQTPPANPKSTAATGSEEEKENVERVAGDWLASVEMGGTASGWKTLARATSSKVDQEKWQAAIAKMRQEFGAPTTRTVRKSQLFPKEQQSGREQDFYLVEFDSISVERGALREMVRLVQADDGAWRVAGYTIEQRHQGGDADED